MRFTVNEENIEQFRDYHGDTGTIPAAFISGFKIEFISH